MSADTSKQQLQEEKQFNTIFPQIVNLEEKIKQLEFEHNKQTLASIKKHTESDKEIDKEMDVNTKDIELIATRELEAKLSRLKLEEAAETKLMKQVANHIEEKFELEQKLEKNSLYIEGQNAITAIKAFGLQLGLATEDLHTVDTDTKGCNPAKINEMLLQTKEVIANCTQNLPELHKIPEFRPYINQILPHLNNASNTILTHEQKLSELGNSTITPDYVKSLASTLNLASNAYVSMSRRFQKEPSIRAGSFIMAQDFNKLSISARNLSKAAISETTLNSPSQDHSQYENFDTSRNVLQDALNTIAHDVHKFNNSTKTPLATKVEKPNTWLNSIKKKVTPSSGKDRS